jgi:hypothetical protein
MRRPPDHFANAPGCGCIGNAGGPDQRCWRDRLGFEMAAYEVESHPNIRIGRENTQGIGQFVLEVLEESHHVEQFGLFELRIRRSSRFMSSPVDRKHFAGSRLVDRAIRAC